MIAALSLLASQAVAAPLFVEQTASLGAQPCSGADVGCYTNYLQMADVTGDGKLDLLFANAKGFFVKLTPAEPLVILRNDGGLGFTDISANLGGGFSGWVRQIAIGDVNGDGSLDLFAPSAWGDADALFINDGTGTFTDEASTRIAALHSHAGATRFADVDGDGDLDLLIADWGTSPLFGTSWSMHLWLNDGTGHFTNADGRLPAGASLPSGTPVDIDLADVDGDFDLDLLIDTHAGSVQLWLNDGGGTFTDATASHFVATPTGLHYNPVACDVDGDGDLDVFVDNAAGSGANEQLLINDGTGHFTDGTAARLGTVGDAGSDDNGVACIDVNGDGHFDAAVASLTGNERVLINDGTGRFTLSPDAFPVVKDPTLWFDFGDLDGDGRLDAVTGQGEQRGPGSWINRLYVGTMGMVIDTVSPTFRAVESLPAQRAADPVPVRFAVSDGATSDTGPRLSAAFVRYSINGAAQLSVSARFMGGDLFRAVIPPTLVNATVSYEVCAADLAGNSACAAAKSYVSEVALCRGDCDGSGAVDVSELITMVNIALGTAQPSTCPAGTLSGAAVDVALIIQAVNNALDGCPSTRSNLCGNGITNPGEDCDDGGICIGGMNAGTACTGEADCMGAGVCIGGEHADVPCAGAADCPGGACLHCVPQGGDGCAANCTRESDVVFNLVPGAVQGIEIAPGTSGSVTHGDILTIPVPFRGTQTLTIGKERDGRIPVVIRADAVHLEGVPVSSGGCFCPRAVAAKTCGGTVFEPDGVTRSPDCTPGFTAGDAVCAGKNPCTFVHGAGDSASGVIACDGLDGVNVSLTQDSGGASGNSQPPQLTLSGAGTSGSAILSASTAIGGAVCLGGRGCPTGVPALCTGQDASIYGPDGEFCTDDDPQTQRGTPVTALLTTGTASGEVFNANSLDDNTIGPLTVTGHPFTCSLLVGGRAAGGTLASVSVELAQPSVGDIVMTSLLVGGPP